MSDQQFAKVIRKLLEAAKLRVTVSRLAEALASPRSLETKRIQATKRLILN